ncbi:MAG: hypothetical protein OXU45_06600, partial [Candidatus Melainabacteria bacterium]|nr:hypothetical protein [Candidatus Melainabacteria bacterium]
ELPVGLEDLLTQILKSICDQVDLSTKLYVTGMDDPRLQTAIKLELTGEGVPEGLHYIQGDRDRPGNDKITAFALLDRKLTDESGADVLWPSEEEPMSCPLGDFQAGDTLGVMVNTEGTKYEELIPSFSFTASLKAGGDPAVITSLTLGHDSKAYQYELEE